MTNETESKGIDPRLKLLSYSSLSTLHSCPRKFELYRLKATENELDPLSEVNQNLTFAFGHAVGDGIQQVMCGVGEDTVIFNMFCNWYVDLEAINPKQVKSFYHAVVAVRNLIYLRENGFLEDYDVLIYNGKQACELSFRIKFPDDFTLRGSVDAVLIHKVTGAILVLECKTSSAAALNPVTYKNSAQAVGYSVVLDVIAPEVSSYEVLYLIYLTKQSRFETYKFPKTYLQRATWIQEVLLDIESIKMYAGVGVYPMRGESCADWGRSCEYLNQCGLNNKYVTTKLVEGEELDTKVYDIELTLQELIEAQLAKNTGSEEVDSEVEEDLDTVIDNLIDTFDGDLL